MSEDGSPKDDLDRKKMMDEVLDTALARLPDTLDAIREKRRTPRGDDIKRACALIERVWSTFPQLRLTQLISNSIPQSELDRRNNDVFYFEDDEILRWLRAYHQTHRQAPTKAPRGK